MKKIVLSIVILVVLAALLLLAGQAVAPANPEPQEGMKINIDEVCQNALAYMTFADGASAQKFVDECKEGKHPEVIEQYKKSLQLDGASI